MHQGMFKFNFFLNDSKIKKSQQNNGNKINNKN